jgi:hypothetical protein
LAVPSRIERPIPVRFGEKTQSNRSVLARSLKIANQTDQHTCLFKTINEARRRFEQLQILSKVISAGFGVLDFHVEACSPAMSPCRALALDSVHPFIHVQEPLARDPDDVPRSVFAFGV